MTLANLWHRRHQGISRALRLSLAAGASLAVAGAIDRYGQWPLLTATLGPTAYVFAAHPKDETARRRNAIVGHSVGIASALSVLVIFGLWNEPSAATVGHVNLTQAFATGTALAVTLLVLELAERHHAPAAATVVLITTGYARPGPALYGLLAGLALIILASPLLGASTSWSEYWGDHKTHQPGS